MTAITGEEKVRRYICNAIIGAIGIAVIVALVWRIQCSISYYDEVLNIYISYITAALGQRHLVENGYIFSMGDLFNLPFVYLFWRITGGTEGLVLFIRFVYLGFNLGLSLVFWKVFGQYYGKRSMILFGLILITFFPGGMYTVSYDTMALFFSLMGGVLLLGSEVRGNEKTGVYRYFAGICHACMVYSYPLMALAILLLFVGITLFHIRRDHMSGKEMLRYWRPYFFGGMTILGIFFLYVLYVGWENVIFFQEGYLQKSLYGREIGALTETADAVTLTETDAVVQDSVVNAGFSTAEGVSGIADNRINSESQTSLMDNILRLPIVLTIRRFTVQILSLLNYMWIQQKAASGISIVMLIQWAIGLVKKGTWRLLLIPEILLVAFMTHMDIPCFGGTTMYAYVFCWSPFLLFYLEQEDRKQGGLSFLILGLTSVAAFVATGFTSIRTDKAHVGLYCGAICTFLIMIMLVRKKYYKDISFAVALILLIALCNTGMAYIDHFQGADIHDCTYRMQTGAFKGMMTWEADRKYENIKRCLEQISFEDNAFICMTDYDYYAACLDGSLQTKEGNFNLLYYEEKLQAGEEAAIVYETISWPSVVLIDKESADIYGNLRETILKKHYDLVSAEYDYLLYIKK